jgi:hypothetical protein
LKHFIPLLRPRGRPKTKNLPQGEGDIRC